MFAAPPLFGSARPFCVFFVASMVASLTLRSDGAILFSGGSGADFVITITTEIKIPTTGPHGGVLPVFLLELEDVYSSDTPFFSLPASSSSDVYFEPSTGDDVYGFMSYIDLGGQSMPRSLSILLHFDKEPNVGDGYMVLTPGSFTIAASESFPVPDLPASNLQLINGVSGTAYTPVFTIESVSVPEPTVVVLFGIAALGGSLRRERRLA
ncbi:MAG: PEP-CTERM sorting domain-containing protein [Luteolibacter sp.]